MTHHEQPATWHMNILSAEVAQALAEALEDAREQRLTRWTSIWDPVTGFAVIAQVANGDAHQWHIRGPMPQDFAKAWIDNMTKRFAEQIGTVRH